MFFIFATVLDVACFFCVWYVWCLFGCVVFGVCCAVVAWLVDLVDLFGCGFLRCCLLFVACFLIWVGWLDLFGGC